MKVFYLVIGFFWMSSFVAQMVYSKDGMELGERGVFIQSCTKGADEAMMDVNGVQVSTKAYCSCVCDNLIPQLTSTELMNAYENGKMVELFASDKNIGIVMNCLEGNMDVSDDYFVDKSSDNVFTRKYGIASCVDAMMAEEGANTVYDKELATEYCECAIDRLFENGYTYKEILEVDDEDGKSYNEIVMPCVSEIIGEDLPYSANSYVPGDISGGGYSSKVPLVNYLSQGYKLKISIGGIEKYFLFDTGASDLIINGDFEKELLKNGTITGSDYGGVFDFELANNKIVQGQEVTVDNIKIGDYKVNNVVISVLDEGSLLCGKSFLEKFKKWELDSENEVLILYK